MISTFFSTPTIPTLSIGMSTVEIESCKSFLNRLIKNHRYLFASTNSNNYYSIKLFFDIM